MEKEVLLVIYQIISVFPQVVIQGSIGSGVHNDIAIDVVSLTPGCELGGRSLTHSILSLLITTDVPYANSLDLDLDSSCLILRQHSHQL